jgi:hypothetical protein
MTTEIIPQSARLTPAADVQWFAQHPDRQYRVREWAPGDYVFHWRQARSRLFGGWPWAQWTIINRATPTAWQAGSYMAPAGFVARDTDQALAELFGLGLANRDQTHWPGLLPFMRCFRVDWPFWAQAARRCFRLIWPFGALHAGHR